MMEDLSSLAEKLSKPIEMILLYFLFLLTKYSTLINFFLKLMVND